MASKGKRINKAYTRFTRELQDEFCARFGGGMTVVDAAIAVGVSPSTVYKLFREDEGFRAAFEAARTSFSGFMEAEMVRRGAIGYAEPVFDRDCQPVYQRDPRTGELVTDPITGDPIPVVRVQYSDALLASVMKAHDPRYRDKGGDVNVAVGVKTGGVVVVPQIEATAEGWMAKYGNLAPGQSAAEAVAKIKDSAAIDVPFAHVSDPHTQRRLEHRARDQARTEAAAAADPELQAKRERCFGGGVRLEKPDLDRPRRGNGARSESF
jgi:AcrR family transcriptional regulator